MATAVVAGSLGIALLVLTITADRDTASNAAAALAASR
jgi:hypothetical protein